jgi:hypothetical protein
MILTRKAENYALTNSQADDYLHLPAIVEAAESSANAAKEAAVRIRKYLSNPARSQGSAQYNAIMLIRILSENPGHTFTRNLDSKFVNTIKQLLREGRDMAAQAMLREMLDSFESQKSLDEDLAGLINMWKTEKKRASKYAPPVSDDCQFIDYGLTTEAPVATPAHAAIGLSP